MLQFLSEVLQFLSEVPGFLSEVTGFLSEVTVFYVYQFYKESRRSIRKERD